MNVRFYADDCMEDKIDLGMGAWSVDLDKDELWKFRHHLACPPKTLSDFVFKRSDSPKVYGSIFCRPESKGKNKRKIIIRSRQKIKNPEGGGFLRPMLFGGYVFFGDKERGREVSKNQRSMQAYLSLNLQRFIRHQPRRDDNDHPSPEKLPLRLRHCPHDRTFSKHESSLDDADNWIPDTENWQRFARGANAAVHLRRYIKGVRGALEKEFNRAGMFATLDSGGGGFKRLREYYSLRTVEHAWEFRSEDPIGDVERIGEVMAHLYEKRSREEYRVKAKRGIKWTRNSPCYHIELGKNVALRVYAKTTRRIRFEVVSNVNWTDTLKVALSALGKETKKAMRHDVSKDTRSLDDLMLVFGQLRKNAAKRMNDVMEELREVWDEDRRCRPVVDLFAEIACSLPSEFTNEEAARATRTMLQILCYQRGFRGAADVGDYAPILQNLKQRNVVRWDKRRHFYKLNAEFAHAAETFQKMNRHYNSMLGGTTAYRKFHVTNGLEVRDRIRGDGKEVG